MQSNILEPAKCLKTAASSSTMFIRNCEVLNLHAVTLSDDHVICRMTKSLAEHVYDYFHFQPSKDVAIVAMSLFLAAALAIFVITVKTRAWFMIIPTIVGLLEMGGYACRIRMLSHPLRGVYIAMQCLLIIPPSFLALVDYIVLGRLVTMIQAAKPAASPSGYRDLKPKWLTWAFFTAEIVSLALQGAGEPLHLADWEIKRNMSRLPQLRQSRCQSSPCLIMQAGCMILMLHSRMSCFDRLL